MLTEYLKSVFGKENVKNLPRAKIALPLYLRQFSYELVSLYEKTYVFVGSANEVNLRAYKTQKNNIERFFECEAVLIENNCNAQKRKTLIDNGILFVEVGKQVFIPTLGVSVWTGRTAEKACELGSFTPQTQLVALYFLYKDNGFIGAEAIKKKTGLNEMAISRGIAALNALGVLKIEQKGRKKLYDLNCLKSDYLKIISEHCVSPISKKVLLKETKLPKGILFAGLSALSYYSNLAEPEIAEYAVSKSEYLRIKDEIVDFDNLIFADDCVIAEVWKYPPEIFATNGVADGYSVWLSMKDTDTDERTEAAKEQLMEKVCNE